MKMKMKMVGAILALVLCAGLTVTAFAAKTTSTEPYLQKSAATMGIVNAVNLAEDENGTDTDGPDPLDGAANWAVAELEAALENNLILDEMIGNWAKPTDRLVAAEAIARLIESAVGTDIMYIAELNGYDLTDCFADTINDYANFLKQAGISNGVDGVRYDPGGIFTRAQMVTMLGRMAKILFGVDTASFPKGSDLFTDVPDWADEYVGWAGAVGITDGVGGGRFDSNGTLQNQHTGVFSSRAFSHFDKLKHETLRRCELLRTGEYLTVAQMDALKANASDWQSAIAGIGSFADFVAIEPADGSDQQVYMAFRTFDQSKGDYFIRDEGYERMQIKTPAGVRARIFYVTEGGGSGEINIGYRLMLQGLEWVENFYAYTFDFTDGGGWENTTEFVHQLYLVKTEPYMKTFK